MTEQRETEKLVAGIRLKHSRRLRLNKDDEIFATMKLKHFFVVEKNFHYSSDLLYIKYSRLKLNETFLREGIVAAKK